MFNRPQKILNSRPVKEVLWSVTILSGFPYVVTYVYINFTATLADVEFTMRATGHFENLSTPTSIHFSDQVLRLARESRVEALHWVAKGNSEPILQF